MHIFRAKKYYNFVNVTIEESSAKSIKELSTVFFTLFGRNFSYLIWNRYRRSTKSVLK